MNIDLRDFNILLSERELKKYIKDIDNKIKQAYNEMPQYSRYKYYEAIFLNYIGIVFLYPLCLLVENRKFAEYLRKAIKLMLLKSKINYNKRKSLMRWIKFAKAKKEHTLINYYLDKEMIR